MPVRDGRRGIRIDTPGRQRCRAAFTTSPAQDRSVVLTTSAQKPVTPPECPAGWTDEARQCGPRHAPGKLLFLAWHGFSGPTNAFPSPLAGGIALLANRMRDWQRPTSRSIE